MQKHTVATVEELVEIREELSGKVTVTENMDAVISEKENKILELETQLRSVSSDIHDNRMAIIPKLIKQLETILKTLGMPNARFKIDLLPNDKFLSNGTDTLRFLFSANKGGQFNELKKAASGGELSRIMLAIKSVLSKYTQLPTIMFDEIDSGVSGEISNKMAGIMQDMSKAMQVFYDNAFASDCCKGGFAFQSV